MQGCGMGCWTIVMEAADPSPSLHPHPVIGLARQGHLARALSALPRRRGPGGVGRNWNDVSITMIEPLGYGRGQALQASPPRPPPESNEAPQRQAIDEAPRSRRTGVRCAQSRKTVLDVLVYGPVGDTGGARWTHDWWGSLSGGLGGRASVERNGDIRVIIRF
jgi:hypothetical protein